MHPLARLTATALTLTLGSATAAPSPDREAWRRPGALAALGTPEHREAIAALGKQLETPFRGPVLEEALALGARFTSAEVVALLTEASPSSDDAIELLEYVRRRIVDPENGYAVVRWFSFEPEREEAARVMLGPGSAGDVPDPAICAALASATSVVSAHPHAVTGCTVAQVLLLFDSAFATPDQRLTALRRVAPYLVDRQEAYRLVRTLAFEEDRRRAWRLLF